MIVTRGKASVISDVTIDQDLNFLGLYQAKNLHSPESGEALRKGNKDIGNAEIADAAAIALTKLATNPFPSGMIAIWHGTIANIPSGFLICDGNNSTPNLLQKFLQGVAAAGTNPGTTGGSATYQLIEAELAAHTHKQRVYTGSASGGSCSLGGNQTNNSDDGDTLSKGSDSAHENEPAFYDVAFLMKS